MVEVEVMQSFLTTIAHLIEEKKLPALMIGGHAVTALGHARATYDLDLLIPKSSAGQWKAELGKLRFGVFAESVNFLQFEAAADLPLPPIDLMLVDDEVFRTLELTKSDSRPIATPGVLAMIALKLHAIHQPSREDPEKDWSDVIALVKAHHLSLDDPEFSVTVLKHGGTSALERIQAAVFGGN